MERDSQHRTTLFCLSFYGSHEHVDGPTSVVRDSRSVREVAHALERDVPNLEASRADMRPGPQHWSSSLPRPYFSRYYGR
jgi:hypothetical protein